MRYKSGRQRSGAAIADECCRLAGSDTTAISLRAVFYYVIRDARVYSKLQKEIDDANAAGKLSTFITSQESLELNYL